MYVQSYWFHSSLRIEDVQWVSLLLSVEREREGGREREREGGREREREGGRREGEREGGREGEREGGEGYKIIK